MTICLSLFDTICRMVSKRIKKGKEVDFLTKRMPIRGISTPCVA